MTRFRFYRLAILIMAGLCVVIIGEKIYEKIEADRDKKKMEEAINAIIPWDRIDNIDPNRKIRSITRTTEMAQAFAVVSGILKEAQKRNDASRVEVRFYRSDRKIDPQEEQAAGGRIYDTLRIYQINLDNTVSPLGERQLLPPDVVFYLYDWPVLIDERYHLSSFELHFHTAGNVVFVQTDVHRQTPFNDRILTFLDGKIYEDGGPDIIAKVDFHTPIPGDNFTDSRVVRPK